MHKNQKGEAFIGFMIILSLLTWGVTTATKQLDQCKADNPRWVESYEKEQTCKDIPEICCE